MVVLALPHSSADFSKASSRNACRDFCTNFLCEFLKKFSKNSSKNSSCNSPKNVYWNLSRYSSCGSLDIVERISPGAAFENHPGISQGLPLEMFARVFPATPAVIYPRIPPEIHPDYFQGFLDGIFPGIPFNIFSGNPLANPF